MLFERIVLREMAMPLKEPFVTSFGPIDVRRFILVEAHSGGDVGYGEATVLHAPLYSEETVGTAWHVLESWLVPVALERDWEDPPALAERFRPIRRHSMAKAALEGAAWDLFARRQGLSLARVLVGPGAFPQARVPAGVAVGMQPDLPSLVRAVRRCLDRGYRRIKVKIAPGWDEEPLSALRDAFGGFPLVADANSAYTLADVRRLRRLDPLRLMMIEQPLGHDDIVDHARLQAEIETPICLDESILSAEDARKALDLGSCRILNVKVGRVGGLVEARRIHDLCRKRGVPAWCGGMLESGVGRAHNLALASLPHFALPGDLSPSSRYWERDLVEPEIEMSADGWIEVPAAAGVGLAVRRDRIEELTVRRQTFERHP